MHKKITIIFVLFLSIFLFKYNVYAECSYKERKELLNSAKNVDIAYEIETKKNESTGISPDDPDEEIKTTFEEYNFKFTIVNLSNDIFIKYYNLFDNTENYVNYDDLNTGIYTFNDSNYLDIYKYYFEFYSRNTNCDGELMYTKKIIKPKYNLFSMYDICNKKEMEDYKYCKKFITKEFYISESEFIKLANTYLSENTSQKDQKDDNKYLVFLKKYWFYFIIVIMIFILGSLSIIKIKKKRSEL